MALPHIGSWGTPEFGITEWIGRQFAKIGGGYAPLTAQGGSSLFGSPSEIKLAQDPNTRAVYSTQYTRKPTSRTLDVLEKTTSVPSGGQPQPTGGQPQPTGGQPQEDPMARIRAEVESIYAPLMNYYNQAESAITSEYERYRPELEQQYATSLSNIQTERQKGERELASQLEAAMQRREDALSAARRLYDELRMGGRQRFGGASSAGQAFTELTNVEQQRQAGNIWNLYQQAENQIAKYKANLLDQFEQAQKELELAKTSALNQAYSDYQNRLQQIRAMRGQTESARAQTALEALYNLRNQVNQINLASLNLAQQLAANKQMSLDFVDKYAQRVANAIMGGRGTYASFVEQTTTSPTSQMTIGGRQASITTPYQGRIRKPEEELNYLA